ncbi:hypothetical protein GCM10023187_56100 [Nibrella viscosa]|uniref:RNA polymerase sigma-70 factor, ECF subfamily n=1 Tax=Nibrella viscosa TaxID=1084524 RepID=A0ABP8L282_9BACT
MTGQVSTLGAVHHEPSTTVIDSELFIRKTFDEDPKKGCELLFRLYYRPLCTLAVRFVYAKDVAEDLVADVFYTLWNTRAYESITQSYRAYLFRCVQNRAYKYLASELKNMDSLEAASQQETSASDLPEPIMRYEELCHKVEELVAGLPPQCQKIFILNRFEGRTAPDIARELQLSVRTVEVQIARALTVLRHGLRTHWLLAGLCLLFL